MYVSSSCRGNLKGGKKEQNDQNWVGIWISNFKCPNFLWHYKMKYFSTWCLMKMTKQIVKKICHIFFEIQKLFWRKKMCATHDCISFAGRERRRCALRRELEALRPPKTLPFSRDLFTHPWASARYVQWSSE